MPETLLQLAVDKAHQGGHPGETRMKARERFHFWILKLNDLVAEKVKSYRSCQLFTHKGTKEPIAPQRTTDRAWEEVSIDSFGPLLDKRHVLVVQDSMSRFPAVSLVPDTSAAPIMKELDKIYSLYYNLRDIEQIMDLYLAQRHSVSTQVLKILSRSSLTHIIHKGIPAIHL